MSPSCAWLEKIVRTVWASRASASPVEPSKLSVCACSDMFNTTRPEARERYLENLYQASCHLYRGFHRTWKEGLIPEANLRIVPYSRIVEDLEAVMEDLVDFIEVEPRPEFTARLQEQAAEQKTRKSGHRYSLDKFGLAEERIRRDLDFIYGDFEL